MGEVSKTISTQNLVNYDLGHTLEIVMNGKALTIELSGTKSDDFKAKYKTLAEMEQAYREKVAPYLTKYDCYDIDLEETPEVITDLAAYFGELAATGGRGNTGGPQKTTKEPDLETLVDQTVEMLRIQLNKAIGASKMTPSPGSRPTSPMRR